MAISGTSLAVPLGAAPWSALAGSVASSGIGGAVQALCPVLLLAGLLTRPAAAAMILQALLLPLPGAAPELRLFWLALLGWIVVFGAGPLSLDRLVGPGARASALPWATAIARIYAWTTQRLGPVFLLALRVWLAAAPATLALAAFGATNVVYPGWLPAVPAMVAALPAVLTLLLAVLLVIGVAVRPAAIVLLALVPLGAVMTLDDHRLYWLLLLAVLAVEGGGPLALDALLARRPRATRAQKGDESLPHVVIVGAGFGGVAVAQGLRYAACHITLLDRRNHHLFQPLLYQVATAGLSPADIATPIRSMFRDYPNLRVLLGEVSGVDVGGKTVLSGTERIGYDYLVLATGARHGYFGHDDWSAYAPGLKSVEDGIDMRRRLLLAFEQAEDTHDAAMRAAFLTFVIVGGGPTGVELAGAIAELARHGLSGEFRAIDPASARVVLAQSGPRLLPSFSPSSSAAAEASLRRLGVEVLLDRKVERVDAAGVVIDGERLEAHTVLWAAGVMASPAAAWLGVAADRAGRVPVGPDLSVRGADGVFAIGDVAASDAWNGKGVPGLAPAAKQEGQYVARTIRARLGSRPAPAPFRYRHLGSLATIGRQAAVAEFGRLRVRGALAWWLWGAAHIAFLVGGRNRATVVLEWIWAYLTFRRGTRLITGGP